MRRIGLFGSTGSVGRQALDVVQSLPDDLLVTCLAAGTSVEKLSEQAVRWKPGTVVIGEKDRYPALRAALAGRYRGEILAGSEGLEAAASSTDVDTVVSAITGIKGLPVSLAAVRSGKRLALANKESLVAAGPLIMAEARRTGAEIIPVDSEHSALFQALKAGRPEEVERLVLTGSGGPFRTRPLDTWGAITIDEALRHPTWSMGPKITIDSATMMNKALEIVEARHLFDVDASRIQVAIHPQSIVHSLVVFRDGSVVAQMGVPDMRTPIQYAITYPDRLPAPGPGFDARAFSGLTFEEPDPERFPSLRMGFDVAARGGLSGAVFNAANEKAVELFLRGEIPFPAIFDVVGDVLARHSDHEISGLEAVLEADRWARAEVLPC